MLSFHAPQASEASRVLKQLSHPDRLQVLCALSGGERTVNDLIEACGASQSWISQCLARMRTEGLLTSRREGSFVFYRISDPRVHALMGAMARIFCPPSERKRK